MFVMSLLPDKNNDPDLDYVLQGTSCWITVRNVAIYIANIDDGVMVTATGVGEMPDGTPGAEVTLESLFVPFDHPAFKEHAK